MLGSGRLSCSCFDGQTRLAHIRGKLRKKVWINNGDVSNQTSSVMLTTFR
jgi:translation initiation factor 1A